jgi:hypothetical protein
VCQHRVCTHLAGKCQAVSPLAKAKVKEDKVRLAELQLGGQ